MTNSKTLHIVTGASGFIGTRLVHRLLNETDVIVLGVVSNFEAAAKSNTIELPGGRKYIPAFCDLSVSAAKWQIQNYLKQIGQYVPGSIFHLAGPTNQADLHNERKMYDYYTKSSLTISQLANDEYFSLVFASSGKAYGNEGAHPTTILGKAKFIAETIFSTICKYDVKIARIFNVFGFGQKRGYLIPTILDRIISGNTDIILDDPEVLRDFVHVEDVAKDLINFDFSNNGGKSIFCNIASGFVRTPKSIVDDISNITGIPLTITLSGKGRRENESDIENPVPFKPHDDWYDRLEATVHEELKKAGLR